MTPKIFEICDAVERSEFLDAEVARSIEPARQGVLDDAGHERPISQLRKASRRAARSSAVVSGFMIATRNHTAPRKRVWTM